MPERRKCVPEWRLLKLQGMWFQKSLGYSLFRVGLQVPNPVDQGIKTKRARHYAWLFLSLILFIQ
jgi:inner membrane protein involved in colicin E2 resistance